MVVAVVDVAVDVAVVVVVVGGAVSSTSYWETWVEKQRLSESWSGQPINC